MDFIDIKSPAERYKAIADAIRAKNGTTELMHPADMPQAILDIVGGGDITIGADYTSIVYNDDNTITLTDKDGIEHTMECEYTDEKLTSVKYDGNAVKLTYEGDLLTNVGKTAVDLANVQTSGLEIVDHTVKFTVEGEPYEVVSVKDGNSVNKPLGIPEKDGCFFVSWVDSENTVTAFPFTPTTDVTLFADFGVKYTDALYENWNVDRNTYPYVFIAKDTSSVAVIFATSYSLTYIGGIYLHTQWYHIEESKPFPQPNNYGDIVSYVVQNVDKENMGSGRETAIYSRMTYYTNAKDWDSVGTEYYIGE